MNYTRALTLELLEAADWGYRFRLTVRNNLAVKLYFPYPKRICLKFAHTATAQIARWTVHLIGWAERMNYGFILEPGKFQSFEFRARPCPFEEPYQDVDMDYCCTIA